MEDFNYAPLARIVIRYAVGTIIGLAQADALIGDPDVVTALAALIGVCTEVMYGFAVKRGWAK